MGSMEGKFGIKLMNEYLGTFAYSSFESSPESIYMCARRTALIVYTFQATNQLCIPDTMEISLLYVLYNCSKDIDPILAIFLYFLFKGQLPFVKGG